MALAGETETGVFARIIVGLGNPGEQYERNRHNAGFMVVEALAREAGSEWSAGILSRTCRANLGGCRVLLAKPSTYMNYTGRAVYALLSALHQTPGDLLLVVDDMNLPFGRIRIREEGSAGGHNGLESILTILGTDEILRVRMGIGEENMPENRADFVLSDFPPEKQTELGEMITRAGDAVRSILRDGVPKTMTIFNA